MDGAAFIFWIVLGVFDGHWNDFFVPMVIVCLVISLLALLFVAAIYGLVSKIEASEPPGMLLELGVLIERGWEKAMHTSTTCALVVLSSLVLCSILFWQDLLWWSALGRGARDQEANRTEEAYRNYERAVEIASPDRKPASLFLLAESYHKADKLTMAERCFVRAIQSAEKEKADNRALSIAAHQGLARVLISQKKYAQAEAVMRECIGLFDSQKAPLQPMHLRVIGDIYAPASSEVQVTLIGSLQILAETCILQGKYDDAESQFEQAMSSIATTAKTNFRLPIVVSIGYAELLASVPHPNEKFIDKAYEAGRKMLADSFGADSSEVGRLEEKFANVYNKIKDQSKAKTHYARAIALLEKNARNGDFQLLKAMNSYAKLLVAEKRYEDAAAIYKEEESLVGGWHGASTDVQIQIDTCHSEYGELLRKLPAASKVSDGGAKESESKFSQSKEVPVKEAQAKSESKDMETRETEGKSESKETED